MEHMRRSVPGGWERYSNSPSPPRFSPGQLSPVSPQLSPSRELPPLSESQQAALEESFRANRNPHDSDLMLLAVEQGVDEAQIRRWFSHRLACWRQEQGLEPNGRRVDMM
ncbi:homeodomain-only protein-like [Amphibalanus amphitrite]|uniref:homeodomain-only protein-like n=1 Tax=Amphibalanus amphitrite TaxID=1232801 RepID=UPI001C91DD54|nr:homeodomain-only protein-like [Amphibalanus amphitrite]XP_043206596.1 homeodomain-only protein-like [Amphibalanus amphitrite]